MKILLPAYACEPGKGSESAVGWNWALQVARFHQVWVLTRSNNREPIESELRSEPLSNIHFIYHDLPRWMRLWKRGKKGVRFYYVLWQISALPIAFRVHRKLNFDVVHHVTFNPIDMPGFLWLLGPAFIWGPVGGAQVPPAAMQEYFGSEWARERRRIARKRLIRLNPLVRASLRRTTHVLAANADTENALRKLGARNISRHLETAVNLPVSTDSCQVRDGEFSILWAGQLALRKAPMLALDVFEELKRREIAAHLTFVGEGPLRCRLTDEIAFRHLEHDVSVIGAVPYAEMPAMYLQSDAFLFTSLQDTSGNVVLEAMAHALPVVTLDHHGVSEIISPECGVKIPIKSPSQVVDDCASALALLATDRSMRLGMGRAGQDRVRSTFNWDRYGEYLNDIYSQASHNRMR